MTSDSDRFKGKGKQGIGSVKEEAGKMTGNEDLEAKGASEKTEGKVQDTWGKIKETARDAKDKVTK